MDNPQSNTDTSSAAPPSDAKPPKQAPTIEVDGQGNFRIEGPDVPPGARGLSFQCVSDAAAFLKEASISYDPKALPRKTGLDAILKAKRAPPVVAPPTDLVDE